MMWQRLLLRRVESVLLAIVIMLAFHGFFLTAVVRQWRRAESLLPAVTEGLALALILSGGLLTIHLLLIWRGVAQEQLLLPLVGLLLVIGCIMIWRLRPPAAWQQITRGFLPGMIIMALLVFRPTLVERIRRDLPITISLVGLALLLLTAFAGVVDESGARLGVRLGPLPVIQTTEIIKLALIIFLAWYIESEGAAAEGRARRLLGGLRLPALRYFIPGALFVLMATLALVRMADFGAILILGALFLGMFYAGFQPRIFLTVTAIGLALSLLMGLALATTWQVPAVIQHRFIAFLDPWSNEPLLVDGVATGFTIAQGPGYQVQQAIYALLRGGLSGAGLGWGTPGFVPLPHSDFIFAPLMEELGIMGGLAILAAFAILLLRILRVALLLPAGQLFERLLLVGIAIHLCTQLFVMVGGTVNLFPVTGVTVPFLSQGGMAMMVNLTEVGLALALAQRTPGAAL
jgi:cell division protein FtsW (lipid II flippase)